MRRSGLRKKEESAKEESRERKSCEDQGQEKEVEVKGIDEFFPPREANKNTKPEYASLCTNSQMALDIMPKAAFGRGVCSQRGPL